jgi:hypothetical protein
MDHIHVVADHIHVVAEHIHVVREHIHVVREHIHVVAEHIHVVREHIHVVADRIHVVADRIHVVAEHIHVVREHIHVVADHIHVVAEHIHVVVGPYSRVAYAVDMVRDTVQNGGDAEIRLRTLRMVVSVWRPRVSNGSELLFMDTKLIGTAPGGNAKKSRRGGVPSNGFRRDRRRSWIRPLRRTMRALDVTYGLLASSCRVIEACRWLAKEHPIRATRELVKVASLLAEASDHLGLGADHLKATNQQIALSPEYAADAPEALFAVTHEWIDAAAMLAVVSNRLDDSFIALVDYVKGGNAPLDLSELLPKDCPAPRRICFVVRRPSLKFLSRQNSRIFCIHLRRQRSARVTIADAPRRIFRGRAPPFLSTCSL